RDALPTALPARNDSSGIPMWLAAHGRANAAIDTLPPVAAQAGIDWALRAAIGISEKAASEIYFSPMERRQCISKSIPAPTAKNRLLLRLRPRTRLGRQPK